MRGSAQGKNCENREQRGLPDLGKVVKVPEIKPESKVPPPAPTEKKG